MNKVALLAVAAAGVLYAANAVSGLRADTDLKADSKLTELEVLAQRTANTGLELAASQVHRDFDNWRDLLAPTTPVSTTGGTFKAVASGAPAGPIVVAASGTVDTTSFDVYQMLARLAEAPAAVSITSDSTIAALSGGGWVISGRDTPSFSQPNREEGYGLAGTQEPGMWTSSDQASVAVTNELGLTTADQLRGLQGRADVTRSGSDAELRALAGELKRTLTDAYPGDQTFNGTAFGSLGNPVVVGVAGDATFSGTSVGYGALIVEGDLVVSGDFEWHGLVIAESVGAMEVTLEDNATIYGALYVDHGSGRRAVASSGKPSIRIGGTTTGTHAGWSVEDRHGTLQYYTVNEGTVTRTQEGQLLQVEETQRGDATDVEAMTFADDGTFYFINDGDNHPDGSDQKSGLYRVPPGEFDGDPSTPVRAERLGSTGVMGNNNDVMGLLFHEGTLYGLTLKSGRILSLDTATGVGTDVRTFDTQGQRRNWSGLTRSSDGNIYTLSNPDTDGATSGSGDAEVWRFDDFPLGDPTKVATLTGVKYSEAISAHPDGFLYVIEGGATGGASVVRVNPSDGSFTKQDMSHRDVQSFAFYYAGEASAGGGASASEVAPLGTIPESTGMGVYTHTIPWPDHPTINLRVELSEQRGTYTDDIRMGRALLKGTSLKGAAQEAERGGTHLHMHDINNPAYSGPEDLQLLRVSPGMVATNNAMTRADVRFTFDKAFDAPFYLHVMDLDFDPLFIEAYDANGNPVSTASWSLSTTLDLLLENGHAERTVYRWDSGQGRLWPTNTSDAETVAGQLTVANYAEVREIRIRYDNTTSPLRPQSDIMLFGLSSALLYGGGASGGGGTGETSSTVGEPLRYTQRGNAAVYYSTEALGQLAAVLPTVRQTAWVVEYDAFGMDVRGIFEEAASGNGATPVEEPGRVQPRREDANRILICIDGRERKVSSVGLELYFAQGATAGACPAPTDGEETEELPEDPQALIEICHSGQTKQIRAGDLDFWLRQGAQQGGCAEPASGETGSGGDAFVTVCIADRSIRIPAHWVPDYLAGGAVEGPCTYTIPIDERYLNR